MTIMNNENDVKENAIQDEEPQDVAHSTIPATFAGRLNMANFSFNPASNLNSESPTSSKRAQPNLMSKKEPDTTPKGKRKNTHLSPSSSPVKKSRAPASYAPPSTYSHLPELTDILVPNLICAFIGLNPGIQTAVQGHAYAHPSNRFWKLLYSSGCTTRLCRPDEDGALPRLFGLGNTNIVARPTRNGGELSKKEMDEGVSVLEEKMRRYRPQAVAIVGKGIWESVWRVRHGKNITKEEFRYGWQDDEERMGGVEGEWEGARVFVATSTSGLAAGVPYAEKERIWRELGEWVEKRREERKPDECVDNRREERASGASNRIVKVENTAEEEEVSHSRVS